MSTDAKSWAWRQQLRGSRMHRSSLKFLLLSMADRADENHECSPSQRRLELDTLLNEKTIGDGLKELIRLGYIQDTGKRVGPTKTTKVYRLIGVEGREYTQNRGNSKLGVIPVYTPKLTQNRSTNFGGTPILECIQEYSTSNIGCASIYGGNSATIHQVHDVNSVPQQRQVHNMNSCSSCSSNNINKTTTTDFGFDNLEGATELILPGTDLVNDSEIRLAKRYLEKLPIEQRQLVADEWHGKLKLARNGHGKPVANKIGYLNTLTALALKGKFNPSSALAVMEQREKTISNLEQVMHCSEAEREFLERSLDQDSQLSDDELAQKYASLPPMARKKTIEAVHRYKMEKGTVSQKEVADGCHLR